MSPRSPFLSVFSGLLALAALLTAAGGAAAGSRAAAGAGGGLERFAGQALSPEGGPVIRNVTTNLGSFPSSQVPAYARFEITFQIDSPAANPYLPYTTSSPAGVDGSQGISVDAWFTPDNWQTVYQQPAFYYQEFRDELRGSSEWFYPTGNYYWKVRFAPPKPGQWQFKLSAKDAGGSSEGQPQSFTVVSSKDPGFVRVSPTDSRYFQFENGVYFPGLGYNMNYDHVRWTNPSVDNEENFRKMADNGIQLVRMWLSQWGIYGPSWNPWNAMDPEQHGKYIPASSLTFEQAYPGSDVSMKVSQQYNRCMFLGFMKPRPAVKTNTNYRVRIRYKTVGMSGPRVAGKPYGFVAKTGDWLWGSGNYCYESGTGKVVTAYQSKDSSGWEILEGSLNTGSSNFLPNFFLTVENVTDGNAYVDYVWVEEDLGGGKYGPNILPKPWMAHHLYMEQRNSYAFDKVLTLAEQYGVYLRPVILEKEDWIFNRINYQGSPIASDPLCKDDDPKNDPAECPGNKWFYGDYRNVTKVRWLQQAWWRYLQARWGYSTRIHSWELLNEGDPANDRHFTQADEFGRYMRSFKANHHLVSTSFWHSFPKDSFLANSKYPNVDFADIHKYLDDSQADFFDTAQASNSLSLQVGAKQAGGAGKPVIRGEVGFADADGGATRKFSADSQAIWLHNFVWAGVNHSGLIESYWWETDHIYKKDDKGGYQFDHRPVYRTFYNFINQIPLNNGAYQDAAAQTSHGSLVAWGQKDRQQGRAHLWIFNKNHIWNNVVDGVSIQPVSGTVTLGGFQAGKAYRAQWWDTYQPDPARQILRSEQLTAQGDGSLVLRVDNLSRDLAVQISPVEAPPPATATPPTPPGATATPPAPTASPTLPPPGATPTTPAPPVSGDNTHNLFLPLARRP